MSFKRSSSVTSPGPITLMPALSSPRSAYCFMKLPPCPAGTNTNMASGLASFILCRNGAKSGFWSGTLTSSTIWPPPATKCSLKKFSAGLPEREAGTHDIGRALGDDRGAGRHHHFGDFGLRRQRSRGERCGRDAEAGDNVDLLVDDQFLREALGIV